MNNPLQGKRILLADDHAMVRLGFRCLLEGAGATVVGEAENGENAVRLYAELNPDVVVMDVSMPGIGGLAALDRLLAWDAKARVLMLSAHNDDIVPVRALRLGARGYLCKRAAPEEFLPRSGTGACCRAGSVVRFKQPGRCVDRKRAGRVHEAGRRSFGQRCGRGFLPEPEHGWHASLSHQAEAQCAERSRADAGRRA